MDSGAAGPYRDIRANMERTCVPVRSGFPATVSSSAGGGAGRTAVAPPGTVLVREADHAGVDAQRANSSAYERSTAGCSIDFW